MKERMMGASLVFLFVVLPIYCQIKVNRSKKAEKDKKELQVAATKKREKKTKDSIAYYQWLGEKEAKLDSMIILWKENYENPEKVFFLKEFPEILGLTPGF